MTLCLVLIDKGSSSDKALNKPCIESVKGSLNEKALNLQELVKQSIRCSIVGLSAEVRLCKTISQKTQGAPLPSFSPFLPFSPLSSPPPPLLLLPSPPPSPSPHPLLFPSPPFLPPPSPLTQSPSLAHARSGAYQVITDEVHFRDIMLQHCRPPPAKVCSLIAQ